MRSVRPLLFATAAVLVGSAWTVDSVSGAVERVVSAYRDLTPREQATHVLNRLAFGPRPGDVDRVVAMGVDRWIEAQLRPERVTDREMDQLMGSVDKYLDMRLDPNSPIR